MNNENNVAAQAHVKRGKELLENTKKNLHESDGKCPASSSLPYLVLWMTESMILQFEQEPKEVVTGNVLKIGKFQASGIVAVIVLGGLLLALGMKLGVSAIDGLGEPEAIEAVVEKVIEK